jgi:hypothetical protein
VWTRLNVAFIFPAMIPIGAEKPERLPNAAYKKIPMDHSRHGLAPKGIFLSVLIACFGLGGLGLFFGHPQY